jgi:hypothetical protein
MLAIGTNGILMVSLPLFSLIGWLIFFAKKNYSALMGFSFLLVILDMQHLLILLGDYDQVTAQLNIHSFIIYAGVLCFALGVSGIIYSAAAMFKKNTE